MPRVAVFDAGYPPAVAFIRSLGRAGVPIIVGADSRLSAGRFSRYVTEVRSAPSPAETETFVDWVVDGLQTGLFDLVAPTSDLVTFAMAEVADRLPGTDFGWSPSSEAIRACLFKLDFSRAMSAAGFPTPITCGPASVAEALAAAEALGYPVMIKPRSHVVDFGYRGGVASCPAELVAEFAAREQVVDALPPSVAKLDPQAGLPLVQQYLPIARCDVVSVSGCLDADGRPLAVGVSRKLAQWPPKVGVGTLFEALPEQQPYTQRAVDAVRHVLGVGLFELELLVDRQTGEAWPIDLNPRGFGQISLDIATGNDLPRAWYRTVTGLELAGDRRPPRPPPLLWRQGLQFYTGEAVGLARGPRRVSRLRRLVRRMRYPSVGAMMVWYDVAPAIAFVLLGLRHPGGLIRPFLRASAESSHRGSTT